MRRIATLQIALLLVSSLLTLGCAAPWLESFDHEQSIHCRIDNPDRDNVWDTSDINGNGVVEVGEHFGQVIDFDSLPQVIVARPLSAASTQSIETAANDTIENNTNSIFDPVKDLPDSPLVSSAQCREDRKKSLPVVSTLTSPGVVLTTFDDDDLHLFNLTPASIGLKAYTAMQGLQLSQTHRLTTVAVEDKSETKSSHFEIAYGARYLQLPAERFGFFGRSSLLGDLSFDTELNNQLVGPQLSFNWGKRRSGWDFSAGSSLMVGYNITQASQSSSYGIRQPVLSQPVIRVFNPGLAPGASNRRISSSPLSATHQENYEDLSSIGEMHAQAAYQLSRSVAVRLGYSAIYIGSLRRTNNVARFSLPDFGLKDYGTQDELISSVQANIEWRR